MGIIGTTEIPSHRMQEVISLRCTFMHRRVAVSELELDDATGFIQRIGEVYAPEHLPVGIPMRKGVPDRAALNEWWTERSIPASRSGIRDALEALDISSTKMLLVRCYGLSLSDQYWICPENSGLTWEQINFFDNAFSDDVGDVLFGANKKGNELDLSSPDNTSDGNLKKRWKIMAGQRCLVKGGSGPFRQQPFNEAIASEIMRRLDIPHVPYAVIWNGGFPYSVCEDFITRDTELIPAWRIYQTQKKPNDVSVYEHFLHCAESLGIPDAASFLDRMIVLDYLIANEDRHLNNFGALRDAETLEWLGMAPIYDSGSSLGYESLPAQIRSGKNIPCKPFKKHHEEQIKLVQDFSWIRFDQLRDVRNLIYETLAAEEAADFTDEARIAAIADSVERRIETLLDIAQGPQEENSLSTADDVEENTAAAYGPTMTL